MSVGSWFLFDTKQSRRVLHRWENWRHRVLFWSWYACAPAPMSFKREVRLWKKYWTGPSDQNALPTSLQSTLENMKTRQFPNICAVLRVLLLLHVTSEQIERAHSAMKCIKTDLRNAMGEQRLNALVLLYVHKDIHLNYDTVVDTYARRHARRGWSS